MKELDNILFDFADQVMIPNTRLRDNIKEAHSAILAWVKEKMSSEEEIGKIINAGDWMRVKEIAKEIHQQALKNFGIKDV